MIKNRTFCILLCVFLILPLAGCAEVNTTNRVSEEYSCYSGPVTTTDEGCVAEYKIYGTTAEIIVKDFDDNTVSPKNVTINSPASLSSNGVKTVEILMTDTLTVEVDLAAAMKESSDCTIIIEAEENTITVKNGNTILFTADLAPFIDITSRLVYDGKTVKAIDQDGRVVSEFELS